MNEHGRAGRWLLGSLVVYNRAGSRRYEVDTRPVRFKVDARLEGETSNSRVISERSKGCSGPWDPINAWSVCCHGDVDVEAGRVTKLRLDAPNF